MKTPFLLVSSVFATGSSLAFGAQVAGLISVSWLTVPMVVAAYAACGVLAFAIRDYSRPAAYDAPRARRRVRKPGKSVEPVAVDVTFGWTHQTISS